MTPSEQRIMDFIRSHPGQVPERKIRKELHLSHGCIYQTRKKLEAMGLLHTERRGRCLVYYPAHFQQQEPEETIPAPSLARMSDHRTSKTLSKWRTIRKKRMPIVQGSYADVSQWQYDIEAECGNVDIDYRFQAATVTNLDTGEELRYSMREDDSGEVSVSCDD